MPEIKLVYDKYKEKGFEVVSACLFYNRKDELIGIKNIHNKVGSDWPLLIVGGRKGEQGRIIFDTYGWQGVPQLLLLDEEGKLLHYNQDLRKVGGLEKLVKQHLEKISEIKGR